MRAASAALALLIAGGLSAGLAAAPALADWHLQVVYAFQGGLDGAFPTSRLVETGGTLYGTTTSGGSSSLDYGEQCNDITFGCGTVYAVTPDGSETVLHSFMGGSDGAVPVAGLAKAGGVLFGTTLWGGALGYDCDYGCGTVYAVTPVGARASQAYVLPNQYMGANGAYPFAGLVALAGALYGETEYGTANGSGTVFRLTPDGNAAVVYTFAGGSDGAVPVGAMIELSGTLYGTTAEGGGSTACFNGCGTVFSLTPQGTETVLHAFAGGSDGAASFASLIDAGGTLYGTTSAGGGTGCGGAGCGTVFSIGQDGTETVLHAFAGGQDGSNPNAALLRVGNMLYGTTPNGGGNGCGGPGCGTIFKITRAGAETVVHAFQGGDGASPRAALIQVGDMLYGTTYKGGAGCGGQGCGTVFALRP